MINAWFSADFHLGHRNIIRYCNRPFQSTGEMDEAIFGNLNSRVGQSDVLYFLGDFCMGGPDQARRYRDRIVCRHIHVVEGNHDRALRRLKTAFCSRTQLAEIRVEGQEIVLCHYAMRVWYHSSRGMWHLWWPFARQASGCSPVSTLALRRDKGCHGCKEARCTRSLRRRKGTSP